MSQSGFDSVSWTSSERNYARFDRGRRLRRIGIVALARKLLIAWWRYGVTGVVPEGATLKA
jgi:hypothetical protein